MAKQQRSFSVSDTKALYSLAAGRCAFSDCRETLILEASELGAGIKQIGEIAHIVAHSSDGPRGDASFPEDKLDNYDNLILLCPKCHTKIDKQPEKYSVDFLKTIKQEHEAWVKESLSQAIPLVTFAELEVAARAIASAKHHKSTGFNVITPEEKIIKNQLTEKSRAYISMGLARGNEVERFLAEMSGIDIKFPDRLKDGFKQKYLELRKTHTGDYLFEAMLSFSQEGLKNFTELAAGLSILVHLFLICEIFEK